MHGGVLHAREQQAISVEAPVLGVVFKQDLAQFLIVRVVADAAGDQRQLLDERRLVGATLEISAGPPQRLWPIKCGNRGDDAFHELRRSHRVCARRLPRLPFATVARLAGMPGVPIEVGGGDIEQLEALRMLEVVIEPAESIEILVAMLRDGEIERVLCLEQDLSRADLEDIEDLARSLAGHQQVAQRFLMLWLVSMEYDVEERHRLIL